MTRIDHHASRSGLKGSSKSVFALQSRSTAPRCSGAKCPRRTIARQGPVWGQFGCADCVGQRDRLPRLPPDRQFGGVGPPAGTASASVVIGSGLTDQHGLQPIRVGSDRLLEHSWLSRLPDERPDAAVGGLDPKRHHSRRSSRTSRFGSPRTQPSDTSRRRPRCGRHAA